MSIGALNYVFIYRDVTVTFYSLILQFYYTYYVANRPVEGRYYLPSSGPGIRLHYPICKAICHSASASLKTRIKPGEDDKSIGHLISVRGLY